MDLNALRQLAGMQRTFMEQAAESIQTDLVDLDRISALTRETDIKTALKFVRSLLSRRLDLDQKDIDALKRAEKILSDKNEAFSPAKVLEALNFRKDILTLLEDESQVQMNNVFQLINVDNMQKAVTALLDSGFSFNLSMSMGKFFFSFGTDEAAQQAKIVIDGIVDPSLETVVPTE
jgi:hypothetical protein